ncbi:MAG: aryl-sulfate sulfotransferase [Candidatus Micrarchaeia archaeon]|jgi:hypothetical protein
MKNIYLFSILAVLILVFGCVQQADNAKLVSEDKTVKTIEPVVKQPDITPIIENKTTNSTPLVVPLVNDTAKNETKNETKVPELQKGVVDNYLQVTKYDPEKAWNGYTLIPDNHDTANPRIVEVNMQGEVVWEYILPAEFSGYTNPGFDAELLPNGNVQFVVARKGIFEVDKSGNILWEYRTGKISHDADRLPNGNILFGFGAEDKSTDAQVTEITPSGKVVWTWYAKDHYNTLSYNKIYDQGWTHTNAVLRMDNGDTLISPRNFNLLVEVDASGNVVKEIGKGLMYYQHDPVFLADGNLLFANHVEPNEILEINPNTNEVLWNYTINSTYLQPARDANRLPNGNTLITGTGAILEVTPDKEVVWSLKLSNIALTRQTAASNGFYKAERVDRIVGE